MNLLAEIRAKDASRRAHEAHTNVKVMRRHGATRILAGLQRVYEKRLRQAWSCAANKECRALRPPTPPRFLFPRCENLQRFTTF